MLAGSDKAGFATDILASIGHTPPSTINTRTPNLSSPTMSAPWLVPRSTSKTNRSYFNSAMAARLKLSLDDRRTCYCFRAEREQ